MKVNLPAGFVLNFNNLTGTLPKQTEVDFAETNIDNIATEFAIAGRLGDLNGALDHTEEVDVTELVNGKNVVKKVTKLVKYNPHGTKLLLDVEEAEELTREAELKEKHVPELKDIAIQLNIEADKLKKPELIAAILEAEAKLAETNAE